MSDLRLFELPEPEPAATDDLLAESHEVMARVMAEHKPSRTALLFSGGNDSLVLLDTMARYADEIVTIDTGTGVPETLAFARKAAERYDIPHTIMRPPVSYEELVFTKWGGLPGPGMHRWTYINLKERALRLLRRRSDVTNGRVDTAPQRLGVCRDGW